MDRLWFSLPGPRGIIDNVLDDLDNGQSVILAVPASLDVDWDLVIRRARPEMVWETTGARLALAADPASFLATEFLGESAKDEVSQVRRLAAAPEFGSMRFLVDGCSGESQRVWGTFLHDWATVTHAIPLRSRTVFCVVVRGLPPRELPPNRPGLSVRHWCGVVADEDMLLYAGQRFQDAPYSTLERRVAAAVAARLAQWDPYVVDRFRDEPLERVLAPHAVLCAIAREYGWQLNALKRHGPRWPLGQLDRREHEERVHASALALLNDQLAIERLVWMGQLGVLLPFVEERRSDYVAMLRSSFRLPHVLPDGTVLNRSEELEIGHIDYQVRRYRLPVAPVFAEGLPLLKRIRDHLAHLELVPMELLQDPTVLKLATKSWAVATDRTACELPESSVYALRSPASSPA